MILQIFDTASFEPMITIFLLIFMMALNIYFYAKKQNWAISLVILIFSIYFWGLALSINLPLSPMFQNFFMLFQTLLFVSVSVKTYKR